MLGSAKDNLGLQTAEVYSIPRQCSFYYIGLTGFMDLDRCKERAQCVRLNYSDKSTLAQQSELF